MTGPATRQVALRAGLTVYMEALAQNIKTYTSFKTCTSINLYIIKSTPN